jgi:integrase
MKHEDGSMPRYQSTFDELRLVLSVADEEWRSMILFGLYTGARLSDVASLTWENVDLAAKELRFIARKTGKTIILPLDAPERPPDG